MQQPARYKEHPSLRRAFDRTLVRIYERVPPSKLAYPLGFQRRVVTTTHEIVLPRTGNACPPLRIGYASDFHAGPMTHPKLMAAACELLRDARPDVLLLGGDFVSMRAAHVEEIAPRLADIPAPLGRFAVLGNHDHAADARHVAARLEAVGIQMLTNRNAQLPAPFAHVWICGLDDTGCGDPDAERTLRGADGVRIVLMHGPDGLLVLENRRFDVAFCGHTHGGQIAVPPRNPLHLGKGVLNRAYWRGRFQVGAEGRSTLMVSRGLGCTGLPVRLFATPEVILCTLRWEALKTG